MTPMNEKELEKEVTELFDYACLTPFDDTASIVINELKDEVVALALRCYQRGREEGIDKSLEHCHGVFLDLNNAGLLSSYEQGKLHGAIACENGVYALKSGAKGEK